MTIVIYLIDIFWQEEHHDTHIDEVDDQLEELLQLDLQYHSDNEDRETVSLMDSFSHIGVLQFSNGHLSVCSETRLLEAQSTESNWNTQGNNQYSTEWIAR